MENTEKKLKHLFSELRAQDAQRVPPFDPVSTTSLAISPTRWPFFRRPQFAFAAAAMVLLIAVLVVASSRAHTRSIEKEINQWAALSDWKAPTDALLSVSPLPWDDPTTWPSDFPTNNVSSELTTKKL